jgi:hypothetical protein
MKLNYADLIEAYKKAVIKLKFSKEQMQKMEEQIRELGVENARLSVRAAAGFEQLTPRPIVMPVHNTISPIKY